MTKGFYGDQGVIYSIMTEALAAQAANIIISDLKTKDTTNFRLLFRISLGVCRFLVDWLSQVTHIVPVKIILNTPCQENTSVTQWSKSCIK